MRFKGAIFDMDGTLLDSMPVWRTLGKQYLASQGVEPPDGIANTLKTMTLWESAVYFRDVLKIPKTVDEIMDGINGLIEKQYRECVPLKPHVLAFLEQLKNSGVRCCIVTATDRYLAEAALKRLGITQYFDFMLTCTEEQCGKDKPDIFLMALRRMGLRKEETIVIEDALYAIRTAKLAGFTVAAVHDASAVKDSEEIKNLADFYINSFDEWEAKCV